MSWGRCTERFFALVEVALLGSIEISFRHDSIVYFVIDLDLSERLALVVLRFLTGNLENDVGGIGIRNNGYTDFGVSQFSHFNVLSIPKLLGEKIASSNTMAPTSTTTSHQLQLQDWLRHQRKTQAIVCEEFIADDKILADVLR